MLRFEFDPSPEPQEKAPAIDELGPVGDQVEGALPLVELLYKLGWECFLYSIR